MFKIKNYKLADLLMNIEIFIAFVLLVSGGVYFNITKLHAHWTIYLLISFSALFAVVCFYSILLEYAKLKQLPQTKILDINKLKVDLTFLHSKTISLTDEFNNEKDLDIDTIYINNSNDELINADSDVKITKNDIKSVDKIELIYFGKHYFTIFFSGISDDSSELITKANLYVTVTDNFLERSKMQMSERDKKNNFEKMFAFPDNKENSYKDSLVG